MKKIAYRQMFENETSHAWYVATRNLMFKNISKFLKKDAKILDAGCGTGGTMQFLKKTGFANVIGIDANQDALKYCQKRGIKNIRMGSVNNLPFKKNSFEAVICLDVLYHQGVQPEFAIKEFFRVLKKGGILYSQEPAYNWLRGHHDQIINTNHRFTRKELKDIIQKSGFTITKLSYFNTFFFPAVAAKRLTGKFFRKDTQASDVYPLSKTLNNLVHFVLKTEGALIQKNNLPFGLSLICISKK